MPHTKSDTVIKLTDRYDRGGDQSVSLSVLWTLFQAFDAHVSSCSTKLTFYNPLSPFEAFKSVVHRREGMQRTRVDDRLFLLACTKWTVSTAAPIERPTDTINIEGYLETVAVS